MKIFCALGCKSKEKIEEIVQVEGIPLKSLAGSKELETSKCRTWADICLLRFIEDGCEEYQIVENDRSSLQSGVLVIRFSSAVESSETLTFFRIVVSRQMLQEVMGYDPKTKAGSYADGIIASNVRLNASVTTVVRSLFTNKEHEGQRQKTYGDT